MKYPRAKKLKTKSKFSVFQWFKKVYAKVKKEKKKDYHNCSQEQRVKDSILATGVNTIGTNSGDKTHNKPDCNVN